MRWISCKFIKIWNYNKVKTLVLAKLIEENLINSDDANEFNERNHFIIYKAKWFESWSKKTFGNDYKPDGYYIKLIPLKEKEDAVQRMKRRTSSDYTEEDFEVS